MFGIKKKSLKTKKNMNRFRHANFDCDKFVRKHYMEQGKAYICATVDSMDDVISRYSVQDYEWINQEFAAYVSECAFYVPIEDEIILELSGCHFSDGEKAVIRRVVKDYFGLQLGNKIIEIVENRRRALLLIAMGVLLIAGFLTLRQWIHFAALSEVLVIAAWFFLWSGIEYATLRRNRLLAEKLDAAQLAVLTVRFEEPEETAL